MSAKDHLYIIQSDVTGAIKIGRSKNPQRRLKQLQTGSPYELRLLLVLENMADLERKLHRDLKGYRFRSTQGEWFDFESTGSLPIWICEKIDWDVANTWWEKA